MNRRRMVAALVALCVTLVQGVPALACYDTSAAESRAKNIVMFAVDGFGFGTQALGRAALAGADNRLKLESLPYVGVLSHAGRTRTGFDYRSALWEMVWGIRADSGERPPQAAERVSWLAVARKGGRAVGLVADGELDDAWPLGAVARPGEAGGGTLPEKLAGAPPEFLFGWTGRGREWNPQAEYLARAGVKLADRWDESAAEGRVWYALPGSPGDVLSGGASPTLAEVTERALARLTKASQGFVLLVHVRGLGEALQARDLASAVAHLGLLDEAVGAAVSFAEQTEGTAVLVVSTGDPVNVTLVDGFSPRRLDAVQSPVSLVASRLKAVAGTAEARELVHRELGLEVTGEEATALVALPPAELQRALGERLADAVGVRFTAGRAAVNPVPILAYGPGSWVYGRLLDATEIPALAVGQLWLDPSQLNAVPAASAATGN